jgi:hypothetical protein
MVKSNPDYFIESFQCLFEMNVRSCNTWVPIYFFVSNVFYKALSVLLVYRN